MVPPLPPKTYMVEGDTFSGLQAVWVMFAESGRNKLLEARSAAPDTRVQIK